VFVRLVVSWHIFAIFFAVASCICAICICCVLSSGCAAELVRLQLELTETTSQQQHRMQARAIAHWAAAHLLEGFKSIHKCAKLNALISNTRRVLADVLFGTQARAWRRWQFYMECKVLSAAVKFFIYKSWMNAFDALHRNLENRRHEDHLVSTRGPAQVRWREAFGAKWRDSLSVMHYVAWHKRTAMMALRTLRKGVTPRSTPARDKKTRSPSSDTNRYNTYLTRVSAVSPSGGPTAPGGSSYSLQSKTKPIRGERSGERSGGGK